MLIPFVLWCWLAMLLTHELGHVAAVPLTGGELTYVNLYPGQVPSTLAGPNPRPAVVLWAGFLSGWLLPQAAALALRSSDSLAPAASAWAGFCWLAGGVYLAFGGLERFADTALLVQQGWSVGLMASVGVFVAAVGYAQCRRSLPTLLAQAAGWSAVAVWGCLAVWVAVQWGLADVVFSAVVSGS